MTPADMGEVLALIRVYDDRTVGITDIAAWHRAVGHLDRTDAMDAVAAHYGNTRDRIMPADLAAGVKAIRNQRAASRHSEALELPSKFEPDDLRDARLRAGVALIAAKFRMPDPAPGDDPHSVALVRARRERTTPMPLIAKRRGDGKPIELAKIPGPDWATPEARERDSIAALHEAGRSCGRPACARGACREARAA